MNEILPEEVMRLWRVMPFFISGTLLVPSFLGCITQQPAGPPIRIEATLDGPIANVKGLADAAVADLSPEDGSELERDFVFEEPREVTVVFPSGRIWKTRSRVTVVSEREKTVCAMELTPIDEAVPYGVCVARVDEILGELGVDSSSALFQKVGGWKSVPQREQSGRCTVEDGIEMVIQIKSATFDSTLPRKWFVSCEISVSRFD